MLVRWTLDFGMDSQQVFGGFGRKGSRLRCFVVKLIWPSWNCGQFDGMYVEIGYAWISMVTEEVKGSKYFKILQYPPDLLYSRERTRFRVLSMGGFETDARWDCRTCLVRPSSKVCSTQQKLRHHQ